MLEKLNVSKSPGPDGLHPKILYEATTPLKLIFEASLKLKELPHDWLNANISAVYKKKAKSPNYANISQLVLPWSYEYSMQNNGTIYKGLYDSAFSSQ